jgi:hypothetical protein
MDEQALRAKVREVLQWSEPARRSRARGCMDRESKPYRASRSKGLPTTSKAPPARAWRPISCSMLPVMTIRASAYVFSPWLASARSSSAMRSRKAES